jgi:hypothetical protein
MSRLALRSRSWFRGAVNRNAFDTWESFLARCQRRGTMIIYLVKLGSHLVKLTVFITRESQYREVSPLIYTSSHFTSLTVTPLFVTLTPFLPSINTSSPPSHIHYRHCHRHPKPLSTTHTPPRPSKPPYCVSISDAAFLSYTADEPHSASYVASSRSTV